MIPYNDLDFAIARWKARAAGAVQPTQPVSGAVASEVPVANSPESATVPEEAAETASGLIVIQSEDQPGQPVQPADEPDQK